LLFCLQCYPSHRALHPFPTRRSSDLGAQPCLASARERGEVRRRSTADEHTRGIRRIAEPFLEPVEHHDLDLARSGRRHPEHRVEDRKSTRLNSSHSQISYAVFCLKKK